MHQRHKYHQSIQSIYFLLRKAFLYKNDFECFQKKALSQRVCHLSKRYLLAITWGLDATDISTPLSPSIHKVYGQYASGGLLSAIQYSEFAH
tara:strand:+ start:1274 stop:1549 length:276 start_codon:yes stop_codon:yes gene_type:complete